MPTLYHDDMSVCAQKVRLASAEKGLAYDGARWIGIGGNIGN